MSIIVRSGRYRSPIKVPEDLVGYELGALETGAIIIAASGGVQFAQEKSDLGHGVFTYSIIEAMKKYPTIKVSALKKYIGDRVMQLTNGMQKPTTRDETIAVDWEVW